MRQDVYDSRIDELYEKFLKPGNNPLAPGKNFSERLHEAQFLRPSTRTYVPFDSSEDVFQMYGDTLAKAVSDTIDNEDDGLLQLQRSIYRMHKSLEKDDEPDFKSFTIDEQQELALYRTRQAGKVFKEPNDELMDDDVHRAIQELHKAGESGDTQYVRLAEHQLHRARKLAEVRHRAEYIAKLEKMVEEQKKKLTELVNGYVEAEEHYDFLELDGKKIEYDIWGNLYRDGQFIGSVKGTDKNSWRHEICDLLVDEINGDIRERARRMEVDQLSRECWEYYMEYHPTVGQAKVKVGYESIVDGKLERRIPEKGGLPLVFRRIWGYSWHSEHLDATCLIFSYEDKEYKIAFLGDDIQKLDSRTKRVISTLLANDYPIAEEDIQIYRDFVDSDIVGLLGDEEQYKRDLTETLTEIRNNSILIWNSMADWEKTNFLASELYGFEAGSLDYGDFAFAMACRKFPSLLELFKKDDLYSRFIFRKLFEERDERYAQYDKHVLDEVIAPLY